MSNKNYENLGKESKRKDDRIYTLSQLHLNVCQDFFATSDDNFSGKHLIGK
jgi:hypothetical protein